MRITLFSALIGLAAMAMPPIDVCKLDAKKLPPEAQKSVMDAQKKAKCGEVKK